MTDTGSAPPSDAPQNAAPAPEPLPAPAAQASTLRRFFLLEQELRAAERDAFRPDQPGFAQFVLAREALEAAQSLLEVPERRSAGLILLRDAAALGVRARVLRHGLSLEASDDAWRALEQAEPSVFADTGWSAADRETVREIYARGTDDRVAALAETERATWTKALEQFVPRVVEASQREAELAALVRGRRALRLGGVLALALALVVAVIAGIVLAARSVNAALHKPVLASSIYDGRRFPVSGVVDGDITKIGCHTKSEPHPWLRIDLERPTTVHEVVVFNRTDFADRAVPLSIEVSTDGTHYRPFATRNDLFSVWHAKGTSVVARYVRLTILKTTSLHFNEVQVF